MELRSTFKGSGRKTRERDARRMRGEGCRERDTVRGGRPNRLGKKASGTGMRRYCIYSLEERVRN